MKFLLTVCVFLLTVISSLSVDITVRGTEGEPVIIKCPYPGGYRNYYKYFYKGPYKKSEIILRSDGRKSEGRFSLQDDRKRSFTVTIRNLKMEDAGLYGCRAGAEHYKEVNLIVIRDPQRPRPVQISTSTICLFTNTSTEHSSTEHTSTAMRTDLVSVAGGLGSVLLVLCSGTLLILKMRKRKCGTALFQQNVQHNTETDRIYEEIPNSDITVAASSSNQTSTSHLNTRPKGSTVYTTVTNQQPDSNLSHTHSTNQVTDW